MGAVLRFASFLTVLHQRPIPPLARQARTGEIMRVSILLLSLLVVLAVLSYAEAGKKKEKPVPGPCKVANCKQCNVSGKKCKKCNDGFKPQKKGKKCGPKPCEPNPCENGGKCIFNKKKKVEVCKCPELTAGDRCELRAEVLPPPEPEPEIIVDPVDPEPPAPNLAVPWRDDLRCGPNFKLPSGENAQCDPNNKNGHVCCSPQGWCGKTPAHCTCDGCIDYSPKPVPRPLPKPGSSCPASHPYVHHDGDYCCASNTEKVYAPEGERCDGGPISISSSCCKGDNYVPCSTNLCSNHGAETSWSNGNMNGASSGMRKCPDGQYVKKLHFLEQRGYELVDLIIICSDPDFFFRLTSNTNGGANNKMGCGNKGINSVQGQEQSGYGLVNVHVYCPGEVGQSSNANGDGWNNNKINCPPGQIVRGVETIEQNWHGLINFRLYCA